jgi:hypothetical protein
VSAPELRDPYPSIAVTRSTGVVGLWLRDLESLEAISQDEDARRIFLRMAALSHAGRLPTFLAEIERDDELDAQTKGHLTELASDRAFLLAVEDYLVRTSAYH